MSTEVETIKEKLSKSQSDCKHLGDNLFSIPLKLINMASPDIEKDELQFINPRHTLSGDPYGFSKEEMKSLRSSIKNEGMMHPPLIRFIESEEDAFDLRLISGERRIRSVSQLIKDKEEDCYDNDTGSKGPAAKVYKNIVCRVQRMSDQEAFKRAIDANEEAASIGPAALVALVRYWRKKKCDDKYILESTGKSITWLKDTDLLASLDDTSFAAFSEGKINRQVALELARIDELSERKELLARVINIAKTRIEQLRKDASEELTVAEDKEEAAEIQLAAAQHVGDDDEQADAKKRKERLQKRVSRLQKQKEQIDNREPQATGKDLARAKKSGRKTSKNDSDQKSLTIAKIRKNLLQPAAAWAKAGKLLDEEGNEVENAIDLEDVYLVKLLCEQISKGNDNLLKILKQHNTNKIRRSK